ncbi:hypothetical protein EOD41_12055 [Mucilaginibacter limnophilus]|uniref:Peptidase S41 n=1 Tax=Mucilaginibacter limnophilus TaxID=1932778 RepID=A0A3S2UKY3_9SPHI|nr:S41 family peptidase [Mucilaginibacter limnophilus]RVU00721.1 hypothetical protein EOD41_12055 [Mucilaginibacter limnophilus]
MLFKSKNVFTNTLFTTAVCLGFLCGCKKNDPKPDAPTGPVTNREINQWVIDSLKKYYYWASSLPANPNIDLEPTAFLNTIKDNADRFSFIMQPGGISSLSPTSRVKYGFDYMVIHDDASDRVLGLVTLVLNTSPAHGAGIRRGLYFTKINRTTITQDNAAQLYSQLVNGTTVQLTRATLEDGVVKEGANTTINAAETFEQTALQKNFTADGKKIGYLFFTGFNSAERNDYLTVFDGFKAVNITELILDLRYNGGGDVSAAATLCAMIAQTVKQEELFIEYRGNSNVGVRKDNFGTAASVSNGPSFAQLQQRKLNITKLYVLTTQATASAAELMINNLRPYMTVVQIGETTRGKDEASITITDKRAAKRINWTLQPIVYKVFNAAGIGGYSSGLSPNFTASETDILPLKPFGDETDPFISKAISLITGKVAAGKAPSALKNASVTLPLFNSAMQNNTAMQAGN